MSIHRANFFNKFKPPIPQLPCMDNFDILSLVYVVLFHFSILILRSMNTCKLIVSLHMDTYLSLDTLGHALIRTCSILFIYFIFINFWQVLDTLGQLNKKSLLNFNSFRSHYY